VSVLAIAVKLVPRCHGLVVKSPPSTILRGNANCEPPTPAGAARVAVPDTLMVPVVRLWTCRI